MKYGPGHQILVRIEGQFSKYRFLGKLAGIKDKHFKNWLVCKPVDVCKASQNPSDEDLLDPHSIYLKPTDRLIVPKYLYGKELISNGQQYRVLDYSSTIRPVAATGANTPVNHINQQGFTTLALPDHYYHGCVESFQDRFPPQMQFVLCSDGLYNCFSDTSSLWKWLRGNSGALLNKDGRIAVLERLHSKLATKGGDDDISFVWIYPRKGNNLGSHKTEAV
jgi:hypothetical protein